MKPISLAGFLMADCWPLDSLLKPLTLFAFRLYVAWMFFESGLVKIQSWFSTISLFESEYKVPLLSPEVAAYLATGAELILPVMLVLGVLTRPAALGLFILNIVAVISYSYLWTVAGAGGFWQHVTWGTMLWVIFVFGPGRWAFDAWWSQRLSR